MSAESLKRFLQMLAEGATVRASRYEDQNGYWAKDVEYCDRVRIRMSDATTLFLSYVEVKGLTRDQRLQIDLAPSDMESLGIVPL